MLHGNTPQCVKTQLQPDLSGRLDQGNQLSSRPGRAGRWPLSEDGPAGSRVAGRLGWYSMKPRVLLGSRPPLAKTTAQYGMTLAPTAGMTGTQPRGLTNITTANTEPTAPLPLISRYLPCRKWMSSANARSARVPTCTR